MSETQTDELLTDEKVLQAVGQDMDDRFDREPADWDWIGIGAF